MTSPAQYGTSGQPPNAEDTLRLIAGLPAPEGLADRVNVRLRNAPRTAGLFHWPMVPIMRFRFQAPVLRGAAAAAIVCVVAGGGWQICSRVPSTTAANQWTEPARVGNSGSFSNAGAMRTPDSLDRPVLTHAITAAPNDDPGSKADSGSTTWPKAASTSGASPKENAADSAKKHNKITKAARPQR